MLSTLFIYVVHFPNKLEVPGVFKYVCRIYIKTNNLRTTLGDVGFHKKKNKKNVRERGQTFHKIIQPIKIVLRSKT